MAVMGIRINDGGGGVDTSVANVFAKALFGDPDREMKFARLQSDLATDEYQRAQIRANEELLRQKEAYERSRTETSDFELGTRRDNLPALQDYYGGLVEEPAPVELEPAVPASITSAFPVRPAAISDNTFNDPVAVEEGYSQLPDIARSDIEPDIQEFTPPAPVDLLDLLGPAVTSGARPEGQPSLHVGGLNTLEPPSTGGPASYETLDTMPAPITLGGDEVPVPEDVPFVPEEPVEVDPLVTPEKDAVVGITPEMREAYEREVAAQRARAALIVGGGGTANQVAEGLGRGEGDIRVHSSDPEEARRAMVQLGINPTDETVLGPTDTFGTDAKIRLAQATEAAKPTDLKKNIVSDQFGDREIYVENGVTKMRPVPGGATKEEDLKKGLITGKDSIIYKINPDMSLTVAEGQTGADADGHLTGAGENIQHYNRLVDLNRALNEGRQLTDDEKMLYAQSYNALYGDKTTVSKDASGRDQASTIVVRPPVGTRKPEQLVPGAISTAPEPTVADEVAADQPAVTGPVTTKTVDGREVPVKNYGGWTNPGEKPPVTTEKAAVPGADVTTTTFGEPKGRTITGEAAKSYQHLFETVHAAAELDKYGPGQQPGHIQNALDQFGRNGITEEMLANATVSSETRAFGRALQTFINAVKRRESGAAVSAGEVAEYRYRFTMQPGGDERDYYSARQERVAMMKAARLALTSQMDSGALRALDTEMANNNIDLDWTPPAGKVGPDLPKKKRTLNPGTGQLE